MRTLKQKDLDVETARKKVTQDVEKLIANQNDFDKKIAEISELYKKLQEERKKLKKYRQNIYSDLPSAKDQLLNLKNEFIQMLQYGMQQKSRDMPLQMSQISALSAVTKKETELYQQETYLIQKKLQLEQTLDEYELKLKSMVRQKQDLVGQISELKRTKQSYQLNIDTQTEQDLMNIEDQRSRLMSEKLKVTEIERRVDKQRLMFKQEMKVKENQLQALVD